MPRGSSQRMIRGRGRGRGGGHRPAPVDVARSWEDHWSRNLSRATTERGNGSGYEPDVSMGGTTPKYASWQKSGPQSLRWRDLLEPLTKHQPLPKAYEWLLEQYFNTPPELRPASIGIQYIPIPDDKIANFRDTTACPMCASLADRILKRDAERAPKTPKLPKTPRTPTDKFPFAPRYTKQTRSVTEFRDKAPRVVAFTEFLKASIRDRNTVQFSSMFIWHSLEHHTAYLDLMRELQAHCGPNSEEQLEALCDQVSPGEFPFIRNVILRYLRLLRDSEQKMGSDQMKEIVILKSCVDRFVYLLENAI